MPATANKPVTWERNGKTFEMQNPEAPPTDRQLFSIARILERNPSIPAPKFPRTKGEASTVISKLKVKAS